MMTTGGVTIGDLTRATGVSQSTMYRLLKSCETELGVRIEYRSGMYRLRRWGVFSKRGILTYTADK